MLHALVTGGAGYVGSHVALALQDAGCRITVLDDLSTGMRPAVPRGARFVQGDVGDRALLDALFSQAPPEAVLHFAGSTSATGSVLEPLRYYDNNTCKSRVLIEALVAAPTRPALLFSSSAAVYGAPEMCPVDEEAPTRPLNPYGASKLMTEQMLEDAARAHGLSYLALRYFNVAGAGAGRSVRAAAPGSLLSVALEAAGGLRAHVPVHGLDHPTPDGTGVRDYIHVEDLAAAHLSVLPLLMTGGLAGERAPRVLNCGYGRGWSVLEVLDAVERAAGVSIRRVAAERRPGEASRVIADNRRLLRHTAWRPKRDDLDRIVGDAMACCARRPPSAHGGGGVDPTRFPVRTGGGAGYTETAATHV